jgi:hypothetical protein
VRLPARGGFTLQAVTGGGRVNGFAAINGSKAATELVVEFRQLGDASGVVLFQKPEGFANNFTR